MEKKHLIVLIVMICLSSCKSEPPIERPIDAWYKHLLIYNLDVKTFKDSDGNGKGDFRGLTSKLNYIKNLGVNAIWLSPFQPSPLADDGYDVTDYKSIDPKLGTNADFKDFLKQAKVRGIYVIMDVALNHTSIEHPWFRTRPSWYLWSKKRPADWNKGMGFPVVENDSWHLDSLTNRYYFHRFYHFEPDLNYQNTAVLAEAKSILAYWLDQGVDGFRLDAVPFIIDDPRKDAADPSFDFNILHQLTGFVKRRNPHAVLLGEANVEPAENGKYFAGHHDGLQMMFNFYANQYLFLAMATGDAGRLKKALTETQPKPGIAQWAWFLRNHDEIDLGRLSKGDLNKVYRKMAPDSNMRLYERGIRRRLAPMLNNDSKTLHLAYSLLFALPGTPVIRMGEELGMGDDLRLKERLAIRTPMQWDSTVNAGFSSGTPFRGVIGNGIYDYRRVNVMNQIRDTTSLLHFIRACIKRRQSFPEIDNGEWQVIKTPDKVLGLLYKDRGKRVMIIHNFDGKSNSLDFEGRNYKINAYGAIWQRL